MNLLLILGNGFSIDLINKLGKADEIDVRNLFRLGHSVRFPADNRPGFLSYQWCPWLWGLGARPSKSTEDANALIEEIITCSNMLSDFFNQPELLEERRKRFSSGENEAIHIKAYFELIAYLKCLFVNYNEKISAEELNNFIENSSWGWIDFFQKIKANKCKLTVVSYNYDIWLERILNALDIKFEVVGAGKSTSARVKVIKPHGSICFAPKYDSLPLMHISYKDFEVFTSGFPINKLKTCYNNMAKHSKSFLIPPAGDSSRSNSNNWTAVLRERANEAAKRMGKEDIVIICGMSYWHVDRKELDSLLINLSHEVLISLINPNPPKDLNAVLMSLFKHYSVFSGSEILGDMIL